MSQDLGTRLTKSIRRAMDALEDCLFDITEIKGTGFKVTAHLDDTLKNLEEMCLNAPIDIDAKIDLAHRANQIKVFMKIVEAYYESLGKVSSGREDVMAMILQEAMRKVEERRLPV